MALQMLHSVYKERGAHRKIYRLQYREKERVCM